MDTMERVVEYHETAWIEVDLGVSHRYPETNITTEELRAFHETLKKLDNRNIAIRVNGAVYQGYVASGNVMTLITGEEPQMKLEVQF